MTSKKIDDFLEPQEIKATTNLQQQLQQRKQEEPKYRIVGFYREREFQETPIGKIPKDWNVMEFGEVFDFQRGFSYRKSDLSEEPTDIRFITIDDIEKEGGIKGDAKPTYLREEIQVINRFLLREGDLLIANTDMSKGFIIGAPLYIDKNIVRQSKYITYSMDLTKLLPTREIDTKFFFYFLSWSRIRRLMKSFAHGTNVLHLNHNLVKRINVPFPPLEEQRSIAEVLSSVDQAIEAVDRLIQKLEHIKRVLMQELLTKGIGHKEFQDTPIGKIPKGWKIVKLGDVARVDARAIEPSPGVKYYYVALEDVESNTGRLLKSPEDLTDGGEIRSTKYVFTANHVLYGRLRPYLNKVALPSRDGICSTDILPLLPNTKHILREYLAYVLLHQRFVEYATARMKGTNHPRVKSQDVLNYRFPLPPIEEQQKIIEILSSINNWIYLEKIRNDKLKNIKNNLMNLLLTGAVRVVVEKEYEPAG